MQILSCSLVGVLCVTGARFGRGIFNRSAVIRLGVLLMVLGLPGLLRAQSPPPANYYVSNSGSDSNNGTSPSTPFATINKALGLSTGGQTVAVASGTYASVRDQVSRTTMVTVLGYGATQPIIQGATGPNYAILVAGGSFLTFQNFSIRCNGTTNMVNIRDHPTLGLSQVSHDIAIKYCDLSDPDTGDTGEGSNCVNIRDAAYNITVLGCNIHDSVQGIGGPGQTSATLSCNNVTIKDNTLNTFTADAIQFGSWNNVTIDGNVIENIADPNTTIHNDGIQFTGNTQGATITHNFIAHSQDQLMLIQPAVGPIDNVLVQNNVIWDAGAYAVQSQGITHARFINNTIFKSFYGGLLLRSNGTTVPSDTIVANNSLCGFGYYGGATSAYEDYNYLPTGSGTGAHDKFGTNPSYIDSTNGNFHPASGSPLLAAGIGSWTVSGTNYTAPSDDLDFITRGNPPAIGAYDTTIGNDAISYCGFDYSTTGNVSTLTDGPNDFGWGTTTWTGSNPIVATGLSYPLLPVLGKALSYSSTVNADRVVSPASMPAGYSVVGTDGVTRLGATGTTVWLSFLIEPTVDDPTNTKITEVNLQGVTTRGGTKLSIGDIDGTSTWGLKNPFPNVTVHATSAAPITTNQVAFLVVKVQYVAGTNNDVVSLYVNPPIGDTPPATPDATLTGTDVEPFGTVEFRGNRNSIGDEISVGTSWLSVTSGGHP